MLHDHPSRFDSAHAGRARHCRRAFSLVEILIVVVIIGILAAIVVPQFTDASDNARANNTLSTLKSIRAQLELYRVHHHDQYPTMDQMWDNLLVATDPQGNPDPDSQYGPYILNPPRNPYTRSTTIVEMGSGCVDVGWEYDEATGEIRAVGFDEETELFTPPTSTP